MTALTKLIDGYARIGVANVEDSQKSLRFAFNLLCLFGGISSICYGILYAVLDLWPMAALAVFIATVGLLPFITRGIERRTAVFGIAICCIGFVPMTYLAGRDTLLHLFIVLAVLNAVILRGTVAPAETALLGGVGTLVIVLCHFGFATPALGDAITSAFSRNLAALNITALGMMIISTLLALAQQLRFVQNLLAAEHARSENLLRSLLPNDIAERLKDKPGQVIADGLPAVTLLFADIVDFTPRAARMAPEELVGFLNRIFSTFDVLTAERGLEKIKTIGDAYMVAAGLPVAREDHAEVIADMALAMQDTVGQLSEGMGEAVELRIGIHSGPAIAGVIGTSKVFYDVWGDTVNTASRMESHGVPGRIQITSVTAQLLKNRFTVTSRGPVEIKGVGVVETFWLTGQR